MHVLLKLSIKIQILYGTVTTVHVLQNHLDIRLTEKDDTMSLLQAGEAVEPEFNTYRHPIKKIVIIPEKMNF